MNGNTDYGYGMLDFCRWDRQTLSYDGLCTNNPLMENPAGDVSLSAEELEANALEWVERRSELSRKCARDWRVKNPGRQKEGDKRRRAKILKERKYSCDVCDMAFPDKTKLANHLTGPHHARKAAGHVTKAREKKPPSNICDCAFSLNKDLRKDLVTSKHTKKVALL